MKTQYKRILLVEDSANDVEMTLSALKTYNLANEVVVARDGKEALDYLGQKDKFLMREPGNPIVIILDINLPKISGLDVLKEIKSNELFRTIPVVILTSSEEEKDVEAGYNLGANAYVVKPVDFHEFVEAIKRLGVFWAMVNKPPPWIG